MAVASGVRVLYRGPELSYADGPLYTFLKSSVYEGNGLIDIYRAPVLLGVGSFLLMLPFSVRKDIVRRKQMKYGRRLKGPVLMTPKEFNQVVAGDGIGFKAAEAQAMMRIPLAAEAQHFEIIGDTGTGKTTTLEAIREGAERCGYAVEGSAVSVPGQPLHFGPGTSVTSPWRGVDPDSRLLFSSWYCL